MKNYYSISLTLVITSIPITLIYFLQKRSNDIGYVPLQKEFGEARLNIWWMPHDQLEINGEVILTIDMNHKTSWT